MVFKVRKLPINIVTIIVHNLYYCLLGSKENVSCQTLRHRKGHSKAFQTFNYIVLKNGYIKDETPIKILQECDADRIIPIILTL